jgi:hypothetical protein
MGILTMTRENTSSGECCAAKVTFEVLFPIMTVDVILQVVIRRESGLTTRHRTRELGLLLSPTVTGMDDGIRRHLLLEWRGLMVHRT